jgi:hypothetical protein
MPSRRAISLLERPVEGMTISSSCSPGCAGAIEGCRVILLAMKVLQINIELQAHHQPLSRHRPRMRTIQ